MPGRLEALETGAIMVLDGIADADQPSFESLKNQALSMRKQRYDCELKTGYASRIPTKISLSLCPL